MRAIKEIVRKYQERVYLSGFELLFEINDALLVIEELKQLGVPFWGLDGWMKYEDHVMQLLEVDLSIDVKAIKPEDRAQESARIVKRYIETSLTDDTDYISFMLYPPYGDYFNAKSFEKK